MPVILVLILAVWTLAVVRILAVRATLSMRTLGTYLVLGAFLGIVSTPLILVLTAPYHEQGPWINESISLGCQTVLLLPVIWYLFFRRAHEVTSLVDSFLLAFAVGFGFDLVGALLASSTATAPLKGLSFWPPWQFDREKFSVAGYGYWSGLVAIVIAAALRFGRRIHFPVALGVLMFLLVATEQAALLSPPQEKPDNWLAGFANLTFHGTLTAWIALVALVALSILEAIWVARKKGADSQVKFQFLEELQFLLNALASGRLREFLRLSTFFRLRRQTALAQAELVRSPDNLRLRQVAHWLEQRLQDLELGRVAAAPEAVPVAPFWRSRHLGRIILLAPLAAMVFSPDSIGAFFWSIPLLHFQIAGLPTLLCAALMITIAWWYLAAAGRPTSAGDADDLVQFLGEKTILWVSLFATLLVFFYVNLETLYPFPSLVAYYTHSKLPEFDLAQKNALAHRGQLATLLLLFATAASSTSLGRAARWRLAPIDERRRAALRNALNLAGFSVMVWLCLAIYRPALEWSHQNLGALFFKIQRLFKLIETFGTTGNTVGALTTALFICLLCLGASLLHRVLSDRLEKFFIGESTAPPHQSSPEKARAASTGVRV